MGGLSERRGGRGAGSGIRCEESEEESERDEPGGFEGESVGVPVKRAHSDARPFFSQPISARR